MKKTSLILVMVLLSVLLIGLTGCGISNDDFINAVEKYQIFDEGDGEMKTVADFIRKMESYDGENDKILTMVSAMWSEGKLKEDDRFIKQLKQDSDFVYDKNKYYGELSVNVCIASATDYSERVDETWVFLFSMDKDKQIVPEASALYYGSSYNYQYINTNADQIRDLMSLLVPATDVKIQVETDR